MTGSTESQVQVQVQDNATEQRDINGNAGRPATESQVQTSDDVSEQTAGKCNGHRAATGPRVSPVLHNDSGRPVADPDVEKPPLALCRFFDNYYIHAFGLTLGLHILMMVLSAALVLAGVDVISLNFNSMPLTLLDHPTYLRALAWNNRDEDGSVIGKDTDAATIGNRSRTAENLLLFFRTSQSTVFTAQRLQEMKKVEDRILAVPEYQEFCQLPAASSGASSSPSCLKPLSILRFFDGTYGSAYNDTTFSDIPGTLYRASLNKQLHQVLVFHLAVDAEITNTTAKSSVTRTLFKLGYPLHGYDLKVDNRTEQLEKIRDFEASYFLDILTDTMDNGAGDMEFLFFSAQMLVDALLKQVIMDMVLALGSLAFIFLFMLFMTGSFFITSFGIFSIISSFVTANLIYRFIFLYRYFGIFHVLSIFIILGIGADNIFVFVDTWRATGHKAYPSLAHRLSACYRRAASATLYTSLTTMVAFFSNALSPLLAIQSFGLFSGILVFVNYLSVIIFFPTVIVMYHRRLEHWTWPCCRWRSRRGGNEASTNSERRHPIVRFFRGPFFSMLSHRFMRFVLLGVCLGLIILFSVFAARIKPDEQDIQYYQKGHHFSKAQDLLRYGFQASSEDNVIEVYIVWGLKNQDINSCDKSDITCTGNTRWDPGFDLNPKRAQSAMLNFCNRIQTLSDAEVDKLKIRRDTAANRLEVDCFIERIDAYMKTEQGKSQYVSGTDLTLPTSEEKVKTLITSNKAIYNVTAVSPLLYRYFEVMMGYWLHDGYTKTTGYEDYRTYSDLLGEEKDSFDTRPVFSDPDQYWATKLVYGAMLVKTTLIPGTFSYTKGLPIVDSWENFINEQSALMPSTVSGMFQCTPGPVNHWHFLYVQKELTDTAVQGIAVGISLSFVVITVATKNIITGVLATFEIGIVTLSVVGLIPMAGWKLGVLESINLSLVVGLAVDYVVHLAEGYHASPAQDRLTRTRDMLDHVGISVLSGALTTLGAAAFMLAAVILFFMQFGLFIFATIGFSLFYSLLGFSVLMGLIGPQGDTGSLVPVVSWLRFRLRGKKSHHVKCATCSGKGFHDSGQPKTLELQEI